MAGSDASQAYSSGVVIVGVWAGCDACLIEQPSISHAFAAFTGVKAIKAWANTALTYFIGIWVSAVRADGKTAGSGCVKVDECIGRGKARSAGRAIDRASLAWRGTIDGDGDSRGNLGNKISVVLVVYLKAGAGCKRRQQNVTHRNGERTQGQARGGHSEGSGVILGAGSH